MNVETVVVGPLEENCYLLKKGTQCLVVDPGDEMEKIEQALEGIEVLGILITHAHFDHIGALSNLLEKRKVPIYDFQSGEGTYYVGAFTFDLLATPGHKEDSVSFFFPQEQVMFVGDFVFYHDIGRCDLAGGNFNAMQESIRHLRTFPQEIVLFPGHGPKTTILEEEKNNPYF